MYLANVSRKDCLVYQSQVKYSEVPLLKPLDIKIVPLLRSLDIKITWYEDCITIKTTQY